MITVEQLIEDARSWRGVPFHHQGRTRHGIDCVGLPEQILRERGVLPDDYAAPKNYSRSPMEELDEGLARWCSLIGTPEPGALLAIRWSGYKRVSHVAIYTGSTIIHSYMKYGVVESPFRGIWLKLVRRAYRLPGVIYV